MIILSIITLSFNTKNLTVSCIQSLITQYKTELESGEFEVIVVDNGSTDGSAEAVSNFQLEIGNWKLHLVRNKKNYGFSKGNNIGAKKAKGKYLVFLNSDTEVLDGGLIGMVAFLEKNKRVGILGGKLTNPDGTSQPSVGRFYTLLNLFIMLFGGEKAGLLRASPGAITPVDWVSGAAMMVRKDVFENLHGFDEKFFMYVEDMELCFRAKNIGFSTYFYPDVLIRHRELGSSNRTFAIIHIYKGLLYFYKKHMSSIEYTLVRLLLIVKAYIAIAIGMLTHNSYLTSTYRKTLTIFFEQGR